MNTTSEPADYPQHTIGKSFLLHIAPGVLITIVFLVLKPLLDASGYPPLLAFLLAVLIFGLPFMLGVLLNEGKKLNRRFSLQGVVFFRERVSWKTFAWVFAGAFVILFALLTLVGPINTWVAGRLFFWLPGWMFLDETAQYAAYPKGTLIFVFTLHLLITGILLPWVEELYFRGFLLPRISRYQNWAPLFGALFFGLYHVWQLFDFIGVVILGAGLGYVVWWKKDLRLSVSLHVFANVLARVFILLGILAM